MVSKNINTKETVLSITDCILSVIFNLFYDFLLSIITHNGLCMKCSV